MPPALSPHRPSVDPPPRASRTGWIVAGAVIFGCLAALALPVGGFLLWMYAGPDVDEPRAAADQFVGRLERNHDAAAHESLCQQIRARIDLAAFTAAVERIGRPVSHTMGRAAFTNEAGNSASVTVELTGRNGQTLRLDLRLESEVGWQVCDEKLFG
ncbi:Rv0361 family membrane protein [Micromonospora sp. CA-246542]|uniref:Rv0361 family membrane protein n=1 Tax=Micromonospora sp. CA-246542 TaxID=3239959 RepID=UPI003D8D1C1E